MQYSLNNDLQRLEMFFGWCQMISLIAYQSVAMGNVEDIVLLKNIKIENGWIVSNQIVGQTKKMINNVDKMQNYHRYCSYFLYGLLLCCFWCLTRNWICRAGGCSIVLNHLLIENSIIHTYRYQAMSHACHSPHNIYEGESFTVRFTLQPKMS